VLAQGDTLTHRWPINRSAQTVRVRPHRAG
jgi:hypothetical protein